MKLISNATRIFVVSTALAAVALTGCSERSSFETLNETEEPVYRRAKDLLDRGLENEALENFLNLIQERSGNAPESHLDAGNIYLKHLRDPVSAIYHFKRYKALLSRTSSAESKLKLELVDDLIRAATKEFAANFEANVYQDPLERLKLLDTIEQLRKENLVLKDQLSATRTRLNGIVTENRLNYQAQPSEEPVQQQETAQTVTRAPLRPDPEPVSTQQRTYEIKAGDNLYKISRAAYGNSNRWREILEANRDRISDPGNLKVGTRIVLP